MTARSEIFARINGALRLSGSAPFIEPDRNYRTRTSDGLETLVERLEDYGARAHVVPEEQVASCVARTVESSQLSRLIVPDGVPDEWLSGVRVLRDTPPLDADALALADGVLTTCVVAIAQSGTLVLDGSAGMGRRAVSLLPDHHVCVVRAAQIVSSLPEALATLDAAAPLTFISGPSATVDIEMTRVVGVHGPRSLTVVIAAG